MNDEQTTQPLRRLRVDLPELCLAFETSPVALADAGYFLDLETGDVLLVTGETKSQLDEIYEEIYDDDGNERAPFAQALEQYDATDWQKDALNEAHRVEQGFGDHVVRVPTEETRDAYNDMAAFIETVTDSGLRGRLAEAISGRGAFGRFKSIVFDRQDVSDRWHAFKAGRLRGRVIDWLRDEGIEPIVD